jgi:cell division protein FtsZ
MSAPVPRRLIIGVGNAGVTVLDLLAVGNPSMKGLMVVNNDTESLAASVVTDRIAVPEGDPGEGFVAIDGEFGGAVAGASTVVLCGGLGGETGSFLLPALAILAKSAGITVAACVGMPFSFEGRGKKEAATAALEKLYSVCDAVAVIENDRLSGGTPSTAAVGEAFVLSDKTLLASLLAIHRMLSTSGPVKITRSDLKHVLGVPGALTLFGSGSAEGSNRLHEALEKALRSPLLNASGKTTPGSALAGASPVLLLLEGPPDLSFAEVQAAVGEIERIGGERCQIKTGVHADRPSGSPITISVVASSGGERPSDKPVAPRVAAAEVRPERQSAPLHLHEEPAPKATPQTPKTTPQAPKTIPTIPQAKPDSAPSTSTTPRKTTAKQTQGTLDLDTQQRGRFDKSEPTIVAGEDLDIPTFMRKGIKLTPPQRS